MWRWESGDEQEVRSGSQELMTAAGQGLQESALGLQKRGQESQREGW